MIRQTSLYTRHSRGVRRYWPGVVALLLVGAALFVNQNVWAAPAFQTVPPVQTRTPTPVPQATSTPRPGNENNQASPTSTATSQPEGSVLTGIVNVDRLNVREGPGVNFARIGLVLRDETVRIFERDEEGIWWRICCVSGDTIAGWVSAQFIRPDFDATQANSLIPVAGSTASAEVAATAATTATVAASSVTTSSVGLELIISQSPAYVWQGQEFALAFEVTNLGDTPAVDVELRNELPAELSFIAIDVGDEGVLEEQVGNEERLVLSIRWASLDAGATETVTVQLRVAENLPDGAVIDNLAVVAAEGATPFTAGISIGMPPTTPPTFQ